MVRKAGSSPTIDVDSLPDDPALLRSMLAEMKAANDQLSSINIEQSSTILDQQCQINSLEFRLTKLIRARFGRSSEKVDPSQLQLFETEAQSDEQDTSQPEKRSTGTASPKRKSSKSGHGRKPLPPDLPRVRVVYELPEDKRVCPKTGRLLVKIGEQTSEQLEFIPSSLFVIQHVRFKYALESDPLGEGKVYIADKPDRPIDKGLPGPGLLAQVAVSKYSDHLPLNRLEKIFKRHGVELARSTMCDWMRDVADLLDPLVSLMRQRILTSSVIQSDDTPVRLRDTDRPKKSQMAQSRVWIYRGDDDPGHRYTVFDYTATRSGEGPLRWLCSGSDPPGKFGGYLQADAYAGYDRLFTQHGVTEAGCWAHARRKFYDARVTCPGLACAMLALIGQLYDVERMAKEKASSSVTRWQARRELRAKHSRTILDTIKDRLDQERAGHLPKSPIGEAIGYALNHWKALNRYMDDVDQVNLDIDNNAAERELRGLAVGRKNWLFFGSPRGGQTAATIRSILVSCERNGVEPFGYLYDVIDRIKQTTPDQLESLLPDQWKPRPGVLPNAIQPGRVDQNDDL